MENEVWKETLRLQGKLEKETVRGWTKESEIFGVISQSKGREESQEIEFSTKESPRTWS